jgi:hypothetical protein
LSRQIRGSEDRASNPLGRTATLNVRADWAIEQVESRPDTAIAIFRSR